MATPTLTKHTLPGILGPILVDVRAGGRAAPRPAVAVVHGFKGFKDWGMFPPFAERLARAGFTAVSFNVSGSGVDDAGNFVYPERFGHNTFERELADIGTVVDALGRGELGVAPPTGVALVGHSRGGGMAVLHAARDPRIRALATWAAIAHVDRFRGREVEWRAEGRIVIENARTRQLLPLYTDLLDEVQRMGGSSLDISASAGQLSIPWLIVHGEADASVGVEEAEQLAAANRRPTTRLLRIPGSGHTFGAVHPFAGMTPELDRVMLETVSFLAQSLA